MGLNGKQLLDDFKEDEAYGVTKEPEPSYDDSSSDDGDNAWKYLSVGDIKGWADYTNRNYNYRSIPYVGQIIGHAADAATQGIADVAQFVGADGVGDYLNEKAQEGEAELPAMSTPELSLAYLTDPNGLASAFGMMAGSMVSMAPAAAILPELLPARAAAALGRIPTALSAVPKVGGTLEKVAPMAGRWALTGPVEAMMEGGNTEREMLQNGATPEEARQAARDVFAENVGLLTATNALEGGLIGKLKINTPRFANPVLNTASRVAGYAPTTAAEMALQGYEEGAQQGIQNGVEGESPNTAAQILNPMNWTDDQWNAAKLGIAGAVPLMGAMGAIRHFSNGGGSNAASDMLNEAQADINADEAQQAQTVAQQAAQDMQANPYQAPDVQLDTAPIDTGMDVNADTGAASTGTSYDASVLEGDPQYTISDEVSSTDVTPLTDEKMRLLDAAYYQQFGRHLYITSMKRNGDGSSWHDSGQAFDTADDNLEGNADARAWLINKGAELGLVALDEYEHPSAHATGGHIHFSDHGDPLGDNVGISSEDAGTDGGVDLSNLPVGNIAMAISQNTGLPANLIWAQLAHESADGTSQLAQEDHNYGGVKGTDGNYLHFDNDQQFIDYMSNYYPKYREDGIFEAKNADEWAEALKHGGYFTAGLDEYEGGMKRHLAEAGLSENAMSGGRARGGKGSSNGNSAAPDLSTTFDIDADNDGMRDMFSGFASEWSKYANDQKGVNFFGNMFDADGNFEDTPENRIAILEKYGKEFQQYADSQMNQTLDERVNAAINQAVADKDLNRMNALTAAKQAHDTAAMSKLVGPEKRQHFDVGKALAQAKAQRVKTNASTQQAQPQEQTQAAPVQNPAPETTPYGAALFNAQAKELPTEPIARIGALAAMAEDARLMGNMQAHDAVKQEMNRYAQANGISSDLKLDQLPEDQQLAYMQAIYEQKARTAQAVRAMATNETPENLANLDKHINSMQVAAAQIRNMRAQMKQATPTQQAQAPTPTKAKPVPPANQVTDVDPNSHFDINKIEATQKALKAEQAASSAKAKSYMNDADKIVSRYQAGKFDANDSIHQLENLKKKANNDKVLNDSDKNAVMQHADECIAKIKPQEEQNHETENNRKTAETTQSSTAEEHQNQNAEPEKGGTDAEESKVSGHFDTSDFKHTKTGELISAAKLIERDKPKFNRARAMVKKYGGYYNSYAKRFFFKDDADHSKRDAFVADAEKELYGQQAQPEAQEQPKEEPAKAETPKEEAPKKEAKLEQEQPASNGANNPDGFYGFTDGKNPRTVERIKERLATPMDNGETAKDFVESMAKAGDKKVTLKPRGFGFSDYFIDGQKIPKAGYYYFKYLTEHHVFGGAEKQTNEKVQEYIDRLNKVKRQYDRNLITYDEYDKKTSELGRVWVDEKDLTDAEKREIATESSKLDKEVDTEQDRREEEQRKQRRAKAEDEMKKRAEKAKAEKQEKPDDDYHGFLIMGPLYLDDKKPATVAQIKSTLQSKTATALGTPTTLKHAIETLAKSPDTKSEKRGRYYYINDERTPKAAVMYFDYLKEHGFEQKKEEAPTKADKAVAEENADFKKAYERLQEIAKEAQGKEFTKEDLVELRGKLKLAKEIYTDRLATEADRNKMLNDYANGVIKDAEAHMKQETKALSSKEPYEIKQEKAKQRAKSIFADDRWKEVKDTLTPDGVKSLEEDVADYLHDYPEENRYNVHNLKREAFVSKPKSFGELAKRSGELSDKISEILADHPLDEKETTKAPAKTISDNGLGINTENLSVHEQMLLKYIENVKQNDVNEIPESRKQQIKEYAESTAFRAVQTDVGGYMIIGTKRGAFAEADTLTPAETVLFAAYGGTEFSGGKLKTDIGEALAKKYNISTDEATALTAKAKPEEKQRVFLNDEEMFANLESALGLKPSKKASGKDEVSNDNKLFKKADADEETKLKAEIDKLAAEFNKEASKLSANPMFNPKIYEIGAKLGIAYVRLGYTKFKPWAEALADKVGDSVKPWLDSIWNGIRALPTDAEFNETTFSAVVNYCGNRYEAGMTSFEEIFADFDYRYGDQYKDMNGEEGYNSFKDYLHAAFIAMDTRMNPENYQKEETENGEEQRTSGGTSGRPESVQSGTAGVSEGEHEGRHSDVSGEVSGRGGREREADVREHEGADSKESRSGEVRTGRGVEETAGKGAGTGTGEQSASLTIAQKKPSPTEVPGHDYEIKGTEKKTESVRYKQNIAAIKMLKELEADNRMPTPSEQDILGKYNGWGGMGKFFKEGTKENKELKDLLTPEEYAAARSTINDAFYADPDIVKAVWKGVSRLGFKGGRVLDPSMGIGNFFGCMPRDMMQKSRLHGVEIDSLTSRFSKMLYPSAYVENKPFQKAKTADNYFDLVISNIPFGDLKIDGYNIHNYFFASGIDKVRPGGLMVFITSQGSLAGGTDAARMRKYLAGRADMIAAYKMPSGTFANAGTSVGTDIVIFRKRDVDNHQSPYAQNFVNVDDHIGIINGKPEHMGYIGYSMNTYFKDHPENILGTLGEGKNQFGEYVLQVTPKKGTSIAQSLEKAMNKLPQDIYTPITRTNEKAFNTVEANKQARLDEKTRDYEFFIKDGKAYQRQADQAVPVEKNIATVKDYIKLKNTMNALMAAQMDPKATDKQLAALRKMLNKDYDSFVAKHGNLNGKAQYAFRDDPSAGMVMALEKNVKTTGRGRSIKVTSADKAEIFTQRTVQAVRDVKTAKTPSDALVASLVNKGYVDVGYMSKLLNEKESSIVAALKGKIFKDPITEDYVTRKEYLSGNVRQKLAQAEEAAKADKSYEGNVDELKKVVPEDLVSQEIHVNMGSPWIPESDVQAFLDSFDSGLKVTFIRDAAKWYVKGASWRNVPKYKAEGISFMELVDCVMNNRAIEIYDGPKKDKVLDRTKTDAANVVADNLRHDFEKWLWTDKEREKRLVRYYNDNFNNLVNREYDGSHLTFPGMNKKIHMRPWQANVVWRMLQSGNTLIAHCVGAGKTFEMQAAGMEMRRLGIANKPLYCLPNNVVKQFEDDFRKLYPEAKILKLTNEDLPAVPNHEVDTKDDGRKVKRNVELSELDPKERKKILRDRAKRNRTLARIQTEDWDAIIMSHTLFERLPLTPETAASTIKEQIDTMERTIKLAKGSLETKDISNLEKKKLSLQNRLENILHTDLADIGIPFEKLGIDQIFVDEADLFKNLHYATSMERVSGLANSDANRSNDMFAKTQWLTKQNNGRGVVFATGTPISNTMAELFTMMRYLDMRGLKEKELDLFDNWIRTFADIGTGIERKPSGDGFRKVNKVKQFINMADLSKMFRKFADIKTQDDIDLDLPELKGGKPTIVKIAADPELVRYIKEDVPKRVQEMKHTKPGTKGADNMLKLTGDLRKKSLNDDKINACAEKIVQKYNDTTDVKGAQLVFCDMGVPRGVANKVTKKDMEAADLEDKLDNESTYEKLIARLVELGIPREQIAYAQSAKDRDELNEIFKKVDSGDVRVLIGSTQKMGAGTNCQHHLVALHDLDAPWRPRDLEQRHGRILRQGNQNKEVEIFNYVVQDSFDANMWEKLKNKAAIIAQAMSNDTSLRTVEDADVVTLSYAEVESAATGNPLIKKQLDLRGEVTKYNNARTQFMKQQRDAERDIAELPEQIEEQKDIIAKIDDDIKARQDTKGDNFKMEVGGKTYTAREEAQKALEAEMDKLPKEASKTIGKLGGFNVQASATLANGKKLLLVCNRAYSPSTGTVRGLENALRTIEKIRDMRQTDLERYERKLKDAQEIVKLPDQYAEKLEAAENELQEVTRQINETMVEGNGPETPNTGLDEAPTADTEAKYSIDGKPIVGRKYSLAWHGSPARFEQFDLSYMGSGEGAQAHGWGLYFAKNRETSQNRYLDRISGKDSEKTLYAVDIPEENTMLDENKSFAEQPKKVQEAIDKIIDDVPIGWLNRAIRGKSGREFDELTHKYNMWEKCTASGRAYQDRANLLRNYRDAKTDEESMRSADALYDTYEQLYDNGDEMVERYMNDEGLLNREIQSLERRAQSDFDNAAKYDKGLREDFAKSIKDGTGFDLYTRIGHMHYNIYWDYHHGFTKVNPVFEKIQKEYGFDGVSNSQWASLVLNAYGVNGITYNGGIDGRCYVVFDDKAIRIIKKYDANNPDELARQSVDDIVQQIKDTLPNTATFKQDGSRLTATMPNGAKLTFDIKDIIELKGKEAEKARAAHGIPASMPITVNGRAYTVNGNAFIELARDGKTGTAAHELTHVAYELYLTDKEKAALRKAAEKEAMLKGRDIEEEIADNVRDYYLQRKEQKLAKNYGKLMQKIIKAIQTIRDMFTGAYQAKKAMEAITSGEVWTRKANTTSDTAERFSVNPKKAIQNHFGKRAQTQNHPRNVKAMLEDLTKMKVRFGKLDPKMNVVYKKFEGVIRARNANEWETVLPEAGRAIAERLGLKPTDQMNHYIAQWLLDQTGNNRSQEALDFEAAMKKNLPISDQLIDLKTLFSDRNNREADDIVHDIIEYDQKKDPLFSKTTLAKKWRGFYDSVIEELGPVKRLVQEVEKKSGQKIGAAVNPYTAFRLYRGHYGKAMTMIEGKSEDSVKALQTVYPSVDFTGFKTIRMILDECGALHDDARLKDLLAYALACHVLDIHEKNNNVRMRQQNLQNKIAATKDKNLQKKYKKQIDDLEREIMEVPRTEDGLALTEDRCREVIKKHSAEYGQAQQDLVHFSKVTAAILYDAGVIGKKRFNELMHSYPNYIPMFRVFEDNEDVNFGDSLKHMHGSSRRVINPLESIIRNTYEFTRRAERNKARQLIANLTRISDVGEFIEEVDNKKPNDKTTITYYENGEVKYLQTDPDIVKAVNRMGQKQSNWVARFLAIPAKIARACFTTANPAFAVGNVIRDTTDATFYSKYGFKPWDFVRGFLHAIHHDEMFYEWLASGAAQASAISLDRDYTSSTLNQMTKTWKQRLLSRHALSAILDGMQMIGEYSEYGTRIAAYERARTQLAKQGAPHLPAYDLAAAALESRDLMDFARGGTGSRYMNSAIPFANAAIQGIDKTIRTFDFVHDRKNATKALVRLMLWGMLPAFALALMHRDDDWWKELPDWQKETNWIIGKVGNTIIRIPKGQDLALRFFSSLIEKAIDRSKHKAIDYARPFWDALPSFMPIAMLPPLEVITNHTFFTGGPVVPRYQQDLPAAMQYGNETSSIAKFFGKELGISPRNIEHILFGYTGNMGKGLLGLFDTLTGQRSLNTNLDEAPVISRFTVMPYKQSKTVTDFYDKYEEQNKLYREFKATDKKPKDFNPALYQRLKTSLKDMSQVNKDERAAIENPRMPANVRKAKQISFQNRRIAIARKALGADR